MKSEKFFEIFTDLDDDLIENALPKAQEAETVHPASRVFTWKTFALSAAAVIVVFSAVFAGIKLIGSRRLGINEPSTDISANNPGGETKNSLSGTETSVQFGSIEVDWQVYSSAEEIIEHGDIIVSGRVTDISFAIIDMHTGKIVTESSENSESEICTIYHVDVITSYKGCSEEKLQIRMEGGLKNYMVDEQIEVLKEYGGNVINFLADPPKIELGEEYLFVLGQFEDTLPCIINSMQTAFPLNDRTSKEEYSKASIDDIIAYFGGASIVHNNQKLSLSSEQTEAVLAAVEQAVINDCDPLLQLNTVISTQKMKQYGINGYCITAEFNHYEEPQIKEGSDQKVKQICEAVVLIGEDGESSYITYLYIVYSADSVSEKYSGGTFFLSKDSREKILQSIYPDN